MLNLFNNTLFNQRLLAVLILGFSSGLPFSLTGATLQAWFTTSNVNLKTIGALSLIGFPYTLKFLWSPLMDYYGLSGLGKRKSWILLTQLALVVLLFVLSEMKPSIEASTMGVIALAIAFFSASQDISINAYTTDILHPKERGLGAAYTVFSYRIALLVSGGLALIFADYLGWKITYQLMAFIMLLSMLPVYFAPTPPTETLTTKSLYETTLLSIQNMWQRENIILILLFIIFYKVGDALALSLMTNFMLHGLGFSLSEIGVVYKSVSIISMILGGFVGGLFIVRWNLYRALLVFGIAQAFSNLCFTFLAWTGKNFTVMATSVFIENFCSGLSTAAMFAFIMLLCDHRYTASQFALLSAIASLGRVYLGPVAAYLVESVGWAQFFIYSFLLCFPGIFLLILLKEKVLNYAPATT